jgi:hypothetical protein
MTYMSFRILWSILLFAGLGLILSYLYWHPHRETVWYVKYRSNLYFTAESQCLGYVLNLPKDDLHKTDATCVPDTIKLYGWSAPEPSPISSQ